MKNFRTFSLCLVATALTVSACAKDDQPGDTTAATGQSTNNTSAEGDDTETDSGMMTSFSGGDGDGDGDAGDGDGDMTTTATTTGFVPDPGDMPAVAECDPWVQDCPEGEKCVAYSSTGGGSWDSNKCVPANGDGQIGDPCMYAGAVESTDDCGVDSWCWNVNMEGVGTCTPFCDGTPDDPICDPGYGCSIANNGSINICLLECDPLLQDCEGENVCYYDFSGNFVCAFAADMIPTGEPCGFINDCAPGNVCLDATALPSCNGASCCGAFCDLNEPMCATQGTDCTAFFEEGTAPPGYEAVGVCIVPGA
jgi:hypothetical protein